MASFDLAIPGLLDAEGNGQIVDNPNDPGRLTRWGISSRSYPSLNIASLTREQAIAIYRKDWWPPAYDLIKDQRIANKLLSIAVDCGQESTHKCLQNAVRAASGIKLEIDGELGEITLKYVNEIPNQDALLAALKSEVAGHYRKINNPAEINGWLNRAYSA